jgi:5-methylcytosine-specific restriction protein A
MATKTREFRTQASLDAERISRNAVVPFLESRGFKVKDDHRSKTGTAESQVVTAIDNSGKQVKMRVRLCWRWDDGVSQVSAAQLRARLIDDDWDKTLAAIVLRDTSEGISHALLFQRSGAEVEYAALIPVTGLSAIWKKQRDVSVKLIAAGKMGRVKKNHAMNGQSPTLWLMDKRMPEAHKVPDVLWNWPNVVDLAKLPIETTSIQAVGDDTFDDMAGPDYSSMGSDGAPHLVSIRSHVKRDPKVRKAVIKRAKNGCESEACEDARRYPGFLDVHHILGVDKSDRYWNCVALCPNCHREAHFGQNRDQINTALLAFASQFQPA